MNNFDAHTIQLSQQLAQAYGQLPVLDQKIVQFFSVVYESIDRNTLLSCLNYINLCDTNRHPFSPVTLKPHLDRLLADGLLIHTPGEGIGCHPLLAEIATRDAVKAGWFETLATSVQNKIQVSRPFQQGPQYFRSQNQFLREVRIAIYRHKGDDFNRILEDYYKYNRSQGKLSIDRIIEQIFNCPFDADWLRSLPKALSEPALSAILLNSIISCSLIEEPFEYLRAECETATDESSEWLKLALTEQLLLRHYIEEARQVLKEISSLDNSAIFWGWLHFLEGKNELAIEFYTRALKSFRKAKGVKQAYFGTVGGLFFILALLKDGSRDRLLEADKYVTIIAEHPSHWLRFVYTQLKNLLQVQLGNLVYKDLIIKAHISTIDEQHSIEILFSSLCLYWVDKDQAKKRLPKLLEPLYQKAFISDYHWLAREAAELLSRLKPRSSYKAQIELLHCDNSIHSLVDIIQPQETWEISLKALANLQKSPLEDVNSPVEVRLVWFITFYNTQYILQPREQKLSKGRWGKGRPIALKRLKDESSEFNYLTPQDRLICSHIEAYSDFSYASYGKTEYRFNENAIVALIGHPLVFSEDDPATRVEIVKGEPELIVKKEKPDRFSLELFPKLAGNQKFVAIKETLTRIKVIEIKPEHQRIAQIIGPQNRLVVPARAQEQVLAAIQSVASLIAIHSDIGGSLVQATEVPAQTLPHIQLLPMGAGLKVALLSRPFAQGGSYYRPGTGGETVIAEIDGQRLQTRRNLEEEKQLADAVVAACPSLTRIEEQEGEWTIEDPDDCLELLLELQALEDRVVLEWPEGETFRIQHQADFKNLHLTLKRDRDWFAMDGELSLDNNLVLSMQQLLQLLEKTPGRFIPLGKGQFLALTQAFRKRLDDLRSFTEKHGKGVRFHPVATLGLKDFVEEVGQVSADQHWQDHIQRLKEVQNLQPEIPSTFQAQLRDYQIEGFQWLARLAHWGVGACLADQMGLGKTIQALALILTRAQDGPTLIVAPTSVCPNWVAETQRFAPTLNIVQFGNSDRQKLLDSLQPFDLLACSYGLLQQEDVARMLSQVEWQTIVLDEAQAIKNMTTKRSQAAMNLKGGFKLIMTGTPLENHLGELWNLFRFINPGLLGSFERFNQRFAIPIERLQDKQTRQRLKKLIQPFLLRRTKTQVLEELPERTEILLPVELSQEEMALYEALRQEAIEGLADSEAKAGQKHLQVLAAIMKLRRVCCNSSLAVSGLKLPSAKLQLFGEILDELLENHHRVLVFSQFVDHLQILRDYLDRQTIQYQYLDGSTPATERKKRVDAFQAGQGEVFLISLKAGGTGINLTAADYVIHMDPWWNPAVEDQASDRAHRLGQQRPVTIYRIVAKNTIEEKIVDLHHHKRDLAESLLEGTDTSAKMSTEELLRLISES